MSVGQTVFHNDWYLYTIWIIKLDITENIQCLNANFLIFFLWIKLDCHTLVVEHLHTKYDKPRSYSYWDMDLTIKLWQNVNTDAVASKAIPWIQLRKRDNGIKTLQKSSLTILSIKGKCFKKIQPFTLLILYRKTRVWDHFGK